MTSPTGASSGDQTQCLSGTAAAHGARLNSIFKVCERSRECTHCKPTAVCERRADRDRKLLLNNRNAVMTLLKAPELHVQFAHEIGSGSAPIQTDFQQSLLQDMPQMFSVNII